MGSDNTLAYLIAAIIAAHFIFGVGYLMYKMQTPSKKNPDQKTK